mgnify:CR=1 FL=1
MQAPGGALRFVGIPERGSECSCCRGRPYPRPISIGMDRHFVPFWLRQKVADIVRRRSRGRVCCSDGPPRSEVHRPTTHHRKIQTALCSSQKAMQFAPSFKTYQPWKITSDISAHKIGAQREKRSWPSTRRFGVRNQARASASYSSRII